MSAKAEFIHLHNHSEYSLLDGTTRFSDNKGNPSELLLSLAQSGARGMALTDHGNLYGAIEFYSQCKKVNLKPIIGCEMYLAKKSRAERGHSQKENCHLTVLAKDFQGYQNLMALASKGFLEGFYYDPRIDKELLAKHSKGLIVLSGCLKSELSQVILSGNLKAAVEMAMTYKELLDPDSFYLEIMDHGLDKQKQVLKALLEIHDQTGIPLAATNDCHYAKKSDFDAHDARVCISTGKLLAETNRLKFESHEFYFKTADEMARIFHFAPEAIKNTLTIAEMCDLRVPMDQLLLPKYEVPRDYTQDSYLERLCKEGLDRRGKGNDPVYQQRLAFELSVIQKMGFSGYFLIVWDFIKYAKTHGVPVGPGRGSGAGSIVSYALDITTVDPIVHNLLFERFLNPDRRSMPDLDIDFSDEGREKVIEYVRKKYGESNVARIITFSSMAARQAIRDVGRVMGVPLAEVDKLAKVVPFGKTIQDCIATPDVQDMARDPQIKKLLDLAQKLEGLKRNTSVHAAGIVITKDAVVNYAPLAMGANSEVVTTQYDGDVLPKLGLLKMDFLGLRTLSIIERAVEHIKARGKKDFDIATIPMDDARAFDLLRAGKCLGVFQLESDGMRELVRKLKPSEFSDVVALVALYRPGPMQSGMVDDFVDRKHGVKKIVYDHPKLKPILADTYGCLVYQEQVMEISKSLAGFTPGQADGLRKAMGKKIPEELEKQRGAFNDGCKKNGIADKLSNKIYDQMVQFGGYGFNKSHSCAYGLVAYQTAYLKANYPIEFMTALLTSEIGHNALIEGKENKLVTYLEEAEHMGIGILPPDIQKSEVLFSIEGDNIRFGLVAIKNVGSGAADAMVASRKNGPIQSLEDFCRRVDLRTTNKKVIESLVKGGAMDCLLPGRPPREARGRLLADVEQTMERQARIKEDLQRGQGLLFGEAPAAPPAAPADGPASADMLSEQDLLKNEKEVLGFYFSGHPLHRHKDKLALVRTHTIEQLSVAQENGSAAPNGNGAGHRAGRKAPMIRLAGMLTQMKRMVTKQSGEPWARATLEDLTGEITLLVFPKAYAAGLGKQLNPNAIVTVGGRLSFRGEETTTPELIVEEIVPLDFAVQRSSRPIVIALDQRQVENGLLRQLRNLLEKYPGNCPVVLQLETGADTVTRVETQSRVAPTEAFFKDVDGAIGENKWQIESAS